MSPVRPFAALVLAVVVGVGVAQAQSVAPAPAPQPPAAPAPAAQVLSIDTPIETLVAVPSAKAVLDADLPGLTDHPMYGQFKRENLRVLAPKFGGAFTDKDLAKVQADLAALPPAATSR